MTIGQRIRTLREKQGMSQAELVRKTKHRIEEQYLKWLENGAADNPTLSTIQILADGLGVKVKDLVDDDECNQTGALLSPRLCQQKMDV